MSNKTFENLLREVLVDLKDLIEYEKPPVDVPKNKQDQLHFFKQHYLSMYIRYLLVFCKLEDCYDQILQPQKREDVKLILESTIARFLEISQILRKIHGEHLDFDDILIDLKTIPEQVEIPIPRYFLEENKKELQRREILLNALLERHRIKDHSLTEEEEVFEEKPLQPMTLQEAVLIIQTAERGRQGRQHAKCKKEIKLHQERVRRVVELGEMQKDTDEAATLIQKIYRGYIARKKAKEMVEKELDFLGMKEKFYSSENDPISTLEKTREKRKLLQQQNILELAEARKTMREKIIKEEGRRMKEEMQDAILERIILFRQANANGGIPEFPSEEDGGSKKFMQDAEEAMTESRPETGEDEKKKGKDKKGKKKETKDKKDKKKKKGEEKPKEKTLTDETKLKEEICDAIEKIIQTWHDRDNPLDFIQRVDTELLRKELMSGEDGIEEELRKEVDKKLREEIYNLKLQIEGEKKKKGKKEKKKKKGKTKKKDEEKDEKKEKEKKDNTEVEALYSELVSQEIVQKYRPVRLKDFYGVHRLLGSLMKDVYEPSLAQVRQVIAETILPLGSKTLHKKCPHIRSILIYGPHKSGKTMLARAIATEIGATFINLSPNVIEKKFEGTKSTTLMIKMVFEVAKEMEPAVIYIDNVEQVFKATKKKKTSGPTRIRKELESQLDKLKTGQRVLVVGNSSEPWEGDLKSMLSFFDRMVYTAAPDYESRQEIFKKCLAKLTNRPLPNNFNLQTLVHASAGYTSGNIVAAIKKVLNPRRIKRLQTKELEVEEFLAPLASLNPVFEKIDKDFRDFVGKLPTTYRKRLTKDDAVEPESEDDKKKKKGTKKKKK